MSFVLACTGSIDENGDCSQALEWVKIADVSYISYSDFISHAPIIFGVLLSVWGTRQLLRMIFNR